MATEQIKLTSTAPTGSTSTKSVSYVDPDASNEQLKTFGQTLNSLTSNRYVKTDRIITINCDTEAGGGKQTPTLQILSSLDNQPLPTDSDFTVDANRITSFPIQYDGDGQLIFETIESNTTLLTNVGSFDQTTHRATFDAYLKATANGQYVHFKIYATETDNFKAVEAGTYQFVAVNA